MNPKDLMYSQKRFSFLHLLSFTLFLCMVLYGGYVFMSEARLNAEIANIDNQIANLEEQVVSLEAQNLDEVTVARKIMTNVEDSEIVWSEVISDLLAVTPMDIYYVSYAGNEDGTLTINGLGDTYASVSGLISALLGEKSFTDVFVSSTAMSSSDSGEVATFSLNFSYFDNAFEEGQNLPVDQSIGSDEAVAVR